MPKNFPIQCDPWPFCRCCSSWYPFDQLRQFEPKVTEKNIIPTVNMDLTSDNAILPNAPAAEKSSFDTEAMRAVDQVLGHMDDKKHDINEYNTLERLVHSLHMREVWFHARQSYEKLKSNPPSADLCQCARDVSNNGILNVLRFIALAVREPTLMYGKHTVLENGALAQWDGNVYSYHFKIDDADKIELPKSDEALPHLNNQAGWQQWKKLMLHDTTEAKNDDQLLALYLYCALN